MSSCDIGLAGIDAALGRTKARPPERDGEVFHGRPVIRRNIG